MKPHEWHDIRRQVFERALWQCEHPGCSRPATEIAHRIANTEYNTVMVLKLWMMENECICNYKWAHDNIISNSHNLAASCREHNDFFNCGNNPGKVREILEKIKGGL